MRAAHEPNDIRLHKNRFKIILHNSSRLRVLVCTYPLFKYLAYQPTKPKPTDNFPFLKPDIFLTTTFSVSQFWHYYSAKSFRDFFFAVMLRWAIHKLRCLEKTNVSQRLSSDLSKSFLPRPKTTTAWELIPHRSKISKNWIPPQWVPLHWFFENWFLLIQKHLYSNYIQTHFT